MILQKQVILKSYVLVETISAYESAPTESAFDWKMIP